MLGRVEYRNDADVDQPLLAEFRIVADGDDLIVQLLNDAPWHAGRRDESEIDGARLGKPSSCNVGTSGNSGERVSESTAIALTVPF